MKQLLVAALFATAALAEQDYQAMFEAFKSSFSRSYADAAEEAKRFSNFVESIKTAEAHQAANPLAEFGVNDFADLSAAEFKPRHGSEYHARLAMMESLNEEVYTEEHLVAARGRQIDWRQKGAVTPVKNQGHCGSCWTFSTTGNIEGQWFLAGHPLTSLSEQELTSCDALDGGCHGGSPVLAFRWLLKERGGSISTEAALPYSSTSGVAPSCPSRLTSVGATITGYNGIPRSEDALAAAVYTQGPISVLVDATTLKQYRNGIITNCVSNHVSHAVLAVGFDDNNVPPYWIVKNSWSAGWGEDGYVRIAKGSNQCLIANYAVTAKVAPKAK